MKFSKKQFGSHSLACLFKLCIALLRTMTGKANFVVQFELETHSSFFSKATTSLTRMSSSNTSMTTALARRNPLRLYRKLLALFNRVAEENSKKTFPPLSLQWRRVDRDNVVDASGGLDGR